MTHLLQSTSAIACLVRSNLSPFTTVSDYLGFHIVPSLLSENVQWELLSRLLHRDLSDQRHQTNIHKHHHVSYDLCNVPSDVSNDGTCPQTHRRSFFHCSPNSSSKFEPIDSQVHNPLTMKQFLSRKLRWVTLGGQYNWTEKKYPTGSPPEFPQDIAELVCKAFPDINPEAAIINVYTPGDTLSLHRDVSEESDQGLVSVSLGCDGLFLAGLEKKESNGDDSALVVRLRSGDAVYMSGSARYAWHGVPQIIPQTCPQGISAWPAQRSRYDPETAGSADSIAFEAWSGWMATKRINLNVRQMYAQTKV